VKQVKNVRVLSVSDAIHILRLSPAAMDKLLRQVKTVILRTPDNKPAISEDSFKTLAYSAEARASALETLHSVTLTRDKDQVSGRAKTFVDEIAQCLILYRKYIDTLASIHVYYFSRFDVLHEETGRTAAYVIFPKVIRLLNMACLCLEHGYWDTLTLLRPIDEAVQLAEYFALLSDKEPAKSALSRWFHENVSPGNAAVRKAIGQHLDDILKDETGRSAALYKELHHKKSKELHHTYNGMWEVHLTKIDKGTLVLSGFDYGPCSYPRSLREVAHLLQLSIWTAVQGFIFCFQESLPLENEHLQTLKELDQQFQQLC